MTAVSDSLSRLTKSVRTARNTFGRTEELEQLIAAERSTTDERELNDARAKTDALLAEFRSAGSELGSLGDHLGALTSASTAVEPIAGDAAPAAATPAPVAPSAPAQVEATVPPSGETAAPEAVSDPQPAPTFVNKGTGRPS